MTNEMKHTPGPWQVRGAVKGFRVVFGNMGDIAEMIGKRFSDQELQANAELIARAPTLLAENESLRQQNSELVSMLKISLPMLDKTVGGENCAELARAILAKVQSS